MTESKLRIGIIGAGGFAADHMEAFAHIPEVEVVAFMRRSDGPLREMQERFGVPKGYTDHREMLDDPDIDAIDIITPTDSHKFYALEAIASGRPVLCEKPSGTKCGGLSGDVGCRRERGRCPRGQLQPAGPDASWPDEQVHRRWICRRCLSRQHQVGNVDAARCSPRCRIVAFLA